MPKVLGRYHIISELGRGGMGVVYKAVDPKLERFIAIKCLSDELSDDEITVTRFLREARNVAALNHPHIAQIFLADEDEGKPYFVMEFIDGESLADRLARDQRLMQEQAQRILIECAEALKAAHEENIVHRDIKPGNIMIDRRGRTVLTDFGIASIVHPDQGPKTSKYIMGTPGYLPPEVMTGQAADHRGDIFALGAVYYEMLVGKRLVPGSGIEDTARTLLAADFPELGDLDETLDQSTFGVLGRMLAPDPDKRYQDYDALLADLRPAAASGAAAPDPATEPTRVAAAPSVPVAAAAAPASSATPPATEAITASQGEPPPTLSAPPPAGRHRVRNASLIGVAMLALVVMTVGVVRFAPEQFDQLTERFGGQGEAAVVESGQEPAASAGDAVETEAADSELAMAGVERAVGAADRSMAETTSVEAHAGPTEQSPQSISASESHDGLDQPADQQRSDQPIVAAGAARLMDTQVQSFGDAPEQGHSIESESQAQRQPQLPAEQPPAMAENLSPEEIEPNRDAPLVVAAVPEQRTATPEQSAPTVASMAPATAPSRPAAAIEPPPPTATGVLVLGVGDAIFVDPMVREVEQALAEQGHDIVERGYVSGLAGLLSESELDLTALSAAALAAGAGKAVIVRAMPAGERQLEYYGRRDTAFIVQTETVTYDFNSGRRLGASELQQVEYTALNATRQARDLIAPRLAVISAQLADR